MRLLIPLFSPATGTWGGLTRVIAVKEAAEKAGHTVAFCASGPLYKDLLQRGFCVFPAPPSTMFGLPASISRILERRSQQVSLPVKPGQSVGSWWMVLWLSGMAKTGYLRSLIAAEKKALQEFRPDVLFTDADPGAFLLAASLGLPLASAYAAVMTQGAGSLPWKVFQRAIVPILKEQRIPICTPDELLFNHSILKIIPSIPELDGTDPARPDVCYVGHLLGDILPANPSWMPDGAKRYMFVYMGTGSISLKTLREVLPDIFPSGSSITCLVGAQSIQQTFRVGGVEFRPYIPAEEVLQYCDWTLCHGGQNTIIQSLRRGVPLLLFPGPIFERRFNSQKVAEAGAGAMGEINNFGSGWIGAVLTQREEMASQAAALSKRILSYGGASAAVSALTSICP